jgi:glycosyltransferase 2 family protein
MLLAIRPVGFAGLSLLSTVLDLLTFFFVLRALHAVDFSVVLATFPWIVMAGDLPVSVSGLGARETIAGLLLARFAVAPPVALDASLLYFALTALLPALLGVIPFVARRRRPLRRSSTRDLATWA